MRNPYTAILLLTVLVAAFLFSNKAAHEQDDVDQISAGLRGIDKVLAPGSNLYLQAASAREELIFPVANCLVPHLVAYTTQNTDTMLTMLRLSDNDSFVSAMLRGQKLLWSNSDSQFHYFLTVRH